MKVRRKIRLTGNRGALPRKYPERADLAHGLSTATGPILVSVKPAKRKGQHEIRQTSEDSALGGKTVQKTARSECRTGGSLVGLAVVTDNKEGRVRIHQKLKRN